MEIKCLEEHTYEDKYARQHFRRFAVRKGIQNENAPFRQCADARSFVETVDEIRPASVLLQRGNDGIDTDPVSVGFDDGRDFGRRFTTQAPIIPSGRRR